MKKIAVYRQLEKAKAKIATSSTWAKGALARDKNSKPVSTVDPRACRFCSVGALLVSDVPYLLGDPARDLLDKAASEIRSIHNTDIITANDSSSHKTVMKIWDRAIEMAYKASKKKAPVAQK